MRQVPFVLLTLFVAVGLAAAPAAGQESPEDPAHADLRELRQGVVDAVNAGDVEKLLTFLHENVVVTWLDGTQSRGHDQVREYYRSKTEGEEAIVQSFSLDPKVKELSFLYNDDTAVAYGEAVSHFTLNDGRKLDIGGPWTATVTKADDQWRIAAFHSSVGVFDNPLLGSVRRFALWGIAIAAAVGLLLGAVGLALLRKLRRRPTVASA